ncbi:MAG TPA: hypothetical protein VD794_05130, partial [Flavisolibacter sp.]|nr:hypothetical protein [Flavisolibacter sp.]
MKAKLLLFVLAFIGIDSTDLLAQSVVITPTATAPNKTIIEKGSAITFSVDQYGFRSCSNIFTYRWEVRNSKNVLISAATYYSQLNTPSFTFPDADVYTVSVAVTQSPGSAYSGCTTAITKTATSTITVQNKIPEPNVFAATSFGTMISAFSIDKSGVVTSGPYDYFDPFPNATTTTITAAMGRDKQGNFYYLPTPTFTGNGGKVEVWVKGNKDKDAPFIAATLDLNGTSTANVGLYRLGIDSKGFGWILAGDNDKIYLARFQAKGKT